MTPEKSLFQQVPDRMSKLALIIFTFLLTGVAKSQGVEFPSSPNGQVFDPAGWLGADRIVRLENELSRYRRNHGIEVFVVLWSRSLPSGATLEELALRIGETWSQQDLWAVVLHLPESLHRPVVVSKNISGQFLAEQSVEDTVRSAVSRGMQEPHTRARIEALALETGEELTFYKSRALLEQTRPAISAARALLEGTQPQGLRLFPAMAFIIPTLFLIIILCRFRRRSESLSFPARTWHRRLSASWGGGNQITVSFPPRAP